MTLNKHTLYKIILLTAVGLSASTSADDTEIYFDLSQISDPDAFKPNVLFILDTSGSMTGLVNSISLPADPYNPATSYGSSNDSYVYAYTSDWIYDTRVLRSEIACDAMLTTLASNANTSTPYYEGVTASYTSVYGDWSAFGWWQYGDEDYLECEEDEGIHGRTDATNPYTAVVPSSFVTSGTGNYYGTIPSGGPYSSNASATVDWSKMQNRIFVPANYHDWLAGSVITTDSKTNVMKSAAINIVNNVTGLNLGLMRFNGGNGGYVTHHFSDIEADRTNIISSINALGASGVTPLAETMWEAHRYYAGLSPDYGAGLGDSDAVSDGTYNSPIGGAAAEDCQANYIVYLTDGRPVEDEDKDIEISALGGTCSHTGGTGADDTCLDEMSAYMSNFDYNSDLDGDQSVKVYTIGFATDLDLLEATATDGEDGYFTANDSLELRDAFDQIVTEILQTSTTFVAPSVSVNAFNSLQNRNEIYYALFEPNKFPRWYGNVKKYKINSKGAILGVGMSLNTGKDYDVIGDNTGYFLDNSESYWGGKDGANVQLGGAASQLTNTRTIFTVAGDPTRNNIDLNITDNTISSVLANSAISNANYGIDESIYTNQTQIDNARQKLVNWILGVDVNDDNSDSSSVDEHKFMADPLHSRPIVVTYGGSQSDPDDISTRVLDDVLFSTDNSGAFRATDTDDGLEVFSFIPQQILPNQKTYFENDTDTNRVYGLDGPLTVWRQESNDDDINIEPSDNDHVFAYVGMRRGGTNLYALDVTDRNNPVLKWTILGSGNDPAIITDGFTDLGQTWSRPMLQTVNWSCDSSGENCDTKDVLLFTGGYDTVHDSATAPTTGDKGAAIYMVDADTGVLLWSAGNNNNSSDSHNLSLPMENSIPGDIAAGDMDGDGAIDIVFAVDIQGHVWRIDINGESRNASDFATGGEIADLTDANEFRRFYTGPTVSLSQKRGRDSFFVLTMGTGYVAHPLDKTVDDRVYAIFERNVLSPPKDSNGDISYTTITNSPLLDLTPPSSVAADPEGNAPHGFYKDTSEDGEKFLRRSITQQGFTVYTSYLPDGNEVDVDNSCGSAQLGTSRLFAMNFVTGISAYSSDHIDLDHPGIAPEPVTLLIPDEDDGSVKPVLCVGTECFSPDDDENPFSEVSTQVLYWRENVQ